MKRALRIIALAVISAAVFCAGAEPDKKALPPTGTTNMFSNWIVASSNLTVTAPGAPWGGSKTVFLGRRGTAGAKLTNAPPKREVLEAIAVVLQQRIEQRSQRDKLERLLNGPALSDQYHVHLSRSPDYLTNSSAK